MPHTELSEYRVYRQTIKRLLTPVGLWPGKPPSLLCRFFVGVQLAQLLALIVAMVCFLATNINNVAAATIAISSLMSFVTAFVKLIWMHINRENVSKLHRMLDPHIVELLNRPNRPTDLLKGIVIVRHLAWLFAGGLCTTIVIYASCPLVFMVHQHQNQINPVEYIYIHPAVYPWHVSGSGFGYKLLFIFEFIPHFPLTCVAIGVNSLFTLHVLQMVCQMRELSHRVTHMDEEKDYRIAIRQCVDQYEILVECRDLLDEVYGPVILWMILVNGFILCSLMFQISQMTSLPVERIMLYGTYFITIFTETSMFAWSGTILTEEGEHYRNALYSANWQHNKDLTIFVLMMLGQRSMILTACKFSQVSVHICTKVLNAAMSYYFLLRTI